MATNINLAVTDVAYFEEAGQALASSAETDILILTPSEHRELCAVVENDADSENPILAVKVYTKDHENAAWIPVVGAHHDMDYHAVGLSLHGGLQTIPIGASTRIQIYVGGAYQVKLTALSVGADVNTRGWMSK